MATLAPLFFIGSSFLQVTRTTIISRMGSNFSQIRPLTVELAALECLKNHYFVLWLVIERLIDYNRKSVEMPQNQLIDLHFALSINRNLWKILVIFGYL